MDLQIPYNFKPRDYQLPFLKAFDSGKFDRFVLVWHRRSGKDKTLFNAQIKKMFERVGAYYYFFPTYNQGRKILWDGIDRSGFKFLDHIPKEVRENTNNQEMKIKLVNGSLFQVVGTDNIDSVVGTNPVGCVFSEYSLQDPRAWDYIRPILAENGGWAVFNYTPRGENHGYDLFRYAEESEDWYCQRLTVEDTKAIPKEVLEKEKREIMDKYGDEAFYMQEYMCSFSVPIQGAYYAKQMLRMEKEERITNVPHDPVLPVSTWWDLGVRDSTAVIFTQHVGREVRLIDYLEVQNTGLPEIIKMLQEKDYIYDKHNAPHDIEVRELGTGKSRKEVAASLGIRFQVVPNIKVMDGIDAVRSLLNRVWVDKNKCRLLSSALKNYRSQYNERLQIGGSPVHDWASHGADAMRMLAVGLREQSTTGGYQKQKVYGLVDF